MAIVKPTTEGAVDLEGATPSQAPDFLKSTLSKRVFKATPELIKQYRKGKFGLVAISKSEFEASGGITHEALQAEKAAENEALVSENEALVSENEALKAKIEALEAAGTKSTTKRQTAKTAAEPSE
jgi:hypothetical protein